MEKPVDAEDHNIIIYYPAAAGGGSQRLFRKIGSRSSVYSPESNVRRTGSYIYEDFMATDGTDVKVEITRSLYQISEVIMGRIILLLWVNHISYSNILVPFL